MERNFTTDYLNIMCDSGTPLDKIALLIVAHMLHIHIGFVMNSHYWTTRKDHDLKQCVFVLGFMGQLNFVDIKEKGYDLDSPYNFQKPRCPPADIVEPLSSPTAVPVAEPLDPSSANISHSYFLCSTGPSTPTKAEPSPGPSTPKGDSDNKPKADSTKQKVTGRLDIVKKGIKKPKQRVRNLKCFICKRVCYSKQKLFNNHIAEKHLDYHFKCSYCPKDFKMENALFKHEGHAKHCFKCELCSKTFQYSHQLNDHVKVHTKNICTHAQIAPSNLHQITTCRHIGLHTRTCHFCVQPVDVHLTQSKTRINISGGSWP